MTNSNELRCVIEAIITSVPGNMFHNRALTALAAIVRESGDIQSAGLMVRWGQRPSPEAQAEAVESALMRVNGVDEPFECGYCGREELDCSISPCEDVIADRADQPDPREDR